MGYENILGKHFLYPRIFTDGNYYAHKLTITLSPRKITVPKIIDAENILGKDILFMSISTDRNSYAPIGLPIFLMPRKYSAVIA